MIGPLFDAKDVVRSGLAETRLFRDLLRDPVGLVDIGARWGVSELFQTTSKLFEVLAFEADAEEARRVEERAKNKLRWGGFTVDDRAVADANKTITFYILARANNNSMYPVNPHYYQRYKLNGFELVRQVEVQAVALDHVILVHENEHRNWGEIVKIDAQGAELDILRGAERTLVTRTQCAICEVSFFTPYIGATLFSDVELFLRKQGFCFYGFLDFQHRSTKKLDKRLYRGRERFMQADAVFFRDPLEFPGAHGTNKVRSISVLILASLVLGFFDYCLELVELTEWSENEKHSFIEAIKRLSLVSPEKSTNTVQDLYRATIEKPDDALVSIGQFIDQHRDFQTYHDV